MVNSRLVLINEQNVSTNYNLNTAMISDIGIKLNYEIKDIRHPEKSAGSFSKTVTLAGTPEVNRFFENVGMVNISLNTYNPTKKVKAKYYADEFHQFTGYLRIKSVEFDNMGNPTYQCDIIGQTTNFFQDIRDKYLTDLYNNATLIALGQDFSNYDSGHTVAKSVITASWANLGDSYVYPLIDWGTNNSSTNVRISDLRGCFFLWGYWNRIFKAAGYTWESNFIDSTFFKSLIVTPTKYAELTDSDLNDNKFLANTNGSEVFTKSLSSVSYPFLSYSETSVADINFQSEVYDTGNRFSTPTYTTNVSVTSNNYNVKANISLAFVVKKGVTDVSSATTVSSGQVKVFIYKGASQIAMNILDLTTATLGSSGANNIQLDLPNYVLAGNQNLTVKIQFTSVILVASSGTGTYSLEATVNSGSNFSSEFASKAVYQGKQVYTIDFIPENVKQSDLISWTIKMFNLQVQVDPDNEKNLIIEPYEDWQLGEDDWTDKHDESKPTTVIPCGELDFGKLIMKYSEDQDYFNTIHSAEYGEVYGTYDKVINNDFVFDERKVEVGFAATPIAKAPFSTTVMSTIIKKDNTVVAPTKNKPRILYWAGLTTFSQPQSWYLVDNSGATYYGSVPWAGHVDDPFAPSIDLNWGLPDKVYYTFPNQTWTTNNLYNKYWSKYINQITDKNSKIVTAWFNLTPRDIKNLDFRKVIFFKDAYYSLNKVIDYDPIQRTTTKVELVKLKDYDNFTESTVEFNGGLGGSENSYNKTANSGLSNGENNINNGNETSYILGGSGNFIASGAQSVNLINCENVIVEGDVENFTAVNVSNLTIDHTYSNTSITGKETPITITADTTLNAGYNNKIVYVDATSGDITLTWDCLNMEGVQVKLIRKDNSANQIFITDVGGYGTESFIGNALPYDLGMIQYDALNVTSLNDTIFQS